MELDSIKNALDLYEKSRSENFNFALNKLINQVDPSINIDGFGSLTQKNKKNTILYSTKIKNNNSKKKHIDFLMKSLYGMPESNGSKIHKKQNLNVGIISDIEIYELFESTANFNYISRKDTDNAVPYDFIMISTLHRGIDNSWLGVSHPDSKVQNDLINFIKNMREKNISVVFIAEESTYDFKNYYKIAEECQIIYTNNTIEKNMNLKEIKNNNVKKFKHYINPLIHNPVGSDYSKVSPNHIIYSGIWDADNTMQQAETKRILDSIIYNNYELDLFDEKLNSEDLRFQFPENYLNNILEPLHGKGLEKLYKWALNINEDKYEDSVLNKKIFELQAMGNIILSNYNTYINNELPHINFINDKNDVESIISSRDEEITDLKSKCIRNVIRNHNVYEALNKIAVDLGLKVEKEKSSILVVGEQSSPLNHEDFERQIYDNKTYIDLSDFSKEFARQFDFITFFSEEFIYEEYYLEDMICAFKYTNCGFITKDINYGTHDYIDKLNSRSLAMMESETYLSYINGLEIGKGYNLNQAELVNRKTYHKECESLNLDKKLSVIIPIHNNGKYLEDKCFASLKRSSSFNNLEIIFVNDGSTDILTNKIIKRILRRHPDIIYYEYDEGSGSASRPRNKGVELATTELITYLDPDNEAIGDGYHYLLKNIQEHDVDLVVGNIIAEHNNKRDAGKYTLAVKKANNNKLRISNPRKFLINSGMRVQSIQALIVRKSIIQKNKIEMIEGAAGQDTMFYQELLLNCESVLALDEYIHIYYAAVTGSVTNTISHKFFDKYYILELKRIPFLERYNLLEVYLNKFFNSYIRNWYFKKIDQVGLEHREKAINRLIQIMNLYNEYNHYLENDNRIKMNSLLVESMSARTFANKTKNRMKNEPRIFNSSIEKSNSKKLYYNDISLFYKDDNNTSSNTEIVINFKTEKEITNINASRFSKYNNYNFNFIVPNELLSLVFNENIIRYFLIKNIKNDDYETSIKLFKMNEINQNILKNNRKIINRSINNSSLEYSTNSYSAKETIKLSNQLLEDVNRNLLYKKKLKNIIEEF